MKKKKSVKVVKPQAEPVEARRRPKRFLGPIVLIGLGLLLLLNNLGLIPWSAWTYIWRLWPVILILAGLQRLTNRSSLGRALVLILTLGFVAGVIAYSLTSPAPRLNQDWQDEVVKGIEEVVEELENLPRSQPQRQGYF